MEVSDVIWQPLPRIGSQNLSAGSCRISKLSPYKLTSEYPQLREALLDEPVPDKLPLGMRIGQTLGRVLLEASLTAEYRKTLVDIRSSSRKSNFSMPRHVLVLYVSTQLVTALLQTPPRPSPLQYVAAANGVPQASDSKPVSQSFVLEAMANRSSKSTQNSLRSSLRKQSAVVDIKWKVMQLWVAYGVSKVLLRNTLAASRFLCSAFQLQLMTGEDFLTS